MLDEGALRPAERVLDVGCGCGTVALAAADAVGPAGSVVGIDVSAPMLAQARSRSIAHTNVRYLDADASTHRFDAEFDVAISRFGVMFFRDPSAAFANLRSALRPGARVVFVCWRPSAENPWWRAAYDAAARVVALEPLADPDEPGPFAFGSQERIARVLADAGLTGAAIAAFDAPVVLSEEGLEGAVDFAITNGPVGRRMRAASDEERARVRAALVTTLRPHAGTDRVALPGATWVVRAAVPG